MSKSNHSFYLPDELYQALRARALLNQRSISKEVIHMLTKAILESEQNDLQAANLVRTFAEEHERKLKNQLYAVGS